MGIYLHNSSSPLTFFHDNFTDYQRHVVPYVLQCNELNRGHSTFFYQSKDVLRTKESEFVHFGPITNEGQIWLGIEGTPILLSCTRLVTGRKTLGDPG